MREREKWSGEERRAGREGVRVRVRERGEGTRVLTQIGY